MALAEDVATRPVLSAASHVRDPIIRLDCVSKHYGDTPIIEGLNLDIERGEFLTLLGPSGCGKTTTLKMIAGFETPSSGRILLDGRDMSMTPPYRRPLNTVFQQYALFPHMSVFDNVAFGPRTAGAERGKIKEAVEAALTMVSMAAHAAKRPDQLSGGQQQRVALARAIVNAPKALLLDEPLSALDVKLRRAMQIELKRIHTEIKTTFIFVTHDQDEALTMSSRIAVMNGGRIEQLDRPEVIYTRPATRFVANFIGHANLLSGVLTGEGRGEALVTLDGSGPVRTAAPADLAPGDRVQLVLRPEQLSLCLQSAAGRPGQGLGATLRSIDFQGSTFRYELVGDGGHEFVATLLPQHHISGAAPGDLVSVDWDPAHSWVVAGDPAR